MCRFISRLLRDEEAATATEYAVMLALIIGVVLASIGAVGGQTGGMWGSLDSDLGAAGLGS